jgi:predicted secreted protein
MSIFTGIIVYLLLYWTALFAILPWGNKAAEIPEDGQWGGAPINPRIKQKFLITGVIAAVLWIIVFFLIHYGVIDFRGIARHMAEEDHIL